MSQQTVHSIIKEAVDIEVEFVCDALPVRLIGMNADLMTKYIHFVADRVCLQLGVDKIYGEQCPFSWMNLISVERKSNFFEVKVSEYALANKAKEGDIFAFTTEF